MNLQDFSNELHTAFRKKFLIDLQTYLDRQTETDVKLLKLIAALDRKYESGPEILKEGLPSIFSLLHKQIEDKKNESFTEFYISKITDISAGFPSELVWVQDEDRFSVSNKDSVRIAIAKRGKRVRRSLSKAGSSVKGSVKKMVGRQHEEWQAWTQSIPVQEVIKYHLLDEEFALDILHQVERSHQCVMIELENVLQSYIEDSEENIDLSAFAESLEKKIQTRSDSLRKNLEEKVRELESAILELIHKVGTVERSASQYRKKRVSEKENDFRTKLLKTENQWVETGEMFLDRTQHVTRFLGLWHDIRDLETKFLTDLNDHFKKYLDDPFTRFYDLLDQSIKIIKSSDSVTNQQIEQQKDLLLDYVREQLIEPIRQLQEQQVFTRKAEHFSEELLLIVNQAPQSTSFIHDIQPDKNPPQAESSEMEWRMLLTMTIREQLLSEIRPSNQNYDVFLGDILRELVEIDGIIEVNLESALAVEEESDSAGENEADDVAVEALKRLLQKVKDLGLRSTDKFHSIEKALSDAENEFGRSIVTLLHKADAKELAIFRAKFKVKETTSDWKTQFDANLARAEDTFSVWYRFIGRKTKQSTSGVRKLLGFEDAQLPVSKRADIATYLSETDQKIKGLPYIYQRLFKFDETVNKRFYIPIPEASSTLEKAYEQWRQGFPATFVVVGEKGSGKSTFLELAGNSELMTNPLQKISIENTIYTEQQLVDFLSLELGYKAGESIEEIIDEIRQTDEKKVIAIEQIENCFIRNINGYEAIEKLCYLISETKEQIFWVLSCSRYTWRFLEKTMSVNEYFSHSVQTDTLDADQIEKVITRRHQASGYNLFFEPGDDDRKNRGYRKIQDQPEKAQEYLKNKYFERLTELAEGNVSIAMIFWIRSIRDFDNASFYIQPLEVTSLEILEDLTPQVLFTLAAFVLHDHVSDTDLSMILNLTKEESRLMLIRLRSRGLLLKERSYYSLNHLVYRQIVRGLKERNIIHLV